MKYIKNFFSIFNFKSSIFIYLLFGLFIINTFPIIEIFINSENNIFLQNAIAEETETPKDPPNTINELIETKFDNSLKNKISEFATLIIAFFTPLIAIMVKFIGSLMGDSYIWGNNSAVTGDGKSFDIAQLLYELWDVLRTIVNYIFLLILLFFAFMNVIPYGTDSYNLKTFLPKLIFAIVVVNLTWFGVRVVFDAVDVMSRVVFALPESITSEKFRQTFREKCEITDKPPSKDGSTESSTDTASTSKKLYVKGNCYPEYIAVNPNGALDQDPVKGDIGKEISDLTEKIGKETDEDEKADLVAKKTKLESVQKKMGSNGGVVNYGAVTIYWTDFDYEKFNEGTIAPLFAFSVMQIQNLPRIASSGLQTFKDKGVKIDQKSGYTNLFINSLAGLIIMVLLFLIFLMMLISLFFRIIVLWINIIASPIFALNIVLGEVGSGAPEGDYFGKAAFIKHAFAPVIMGVPLVIGFIMITVGKQYSLLGEENNNFMLQGALIDGVSSIHQLFYYFLTIAVLWVGGVKAINMASADFVQNTFISPISTGVQNLASTLAKAPLYLQFVPIGNIDNDDKTKDRVSFMNLFSDIPTGFKNALNTNSDKVTKILRDGGGGDNPSRRSSDNFYINNAKEGNKKEEINKLLSNLEIKPNTFDSYTGKTEDQIKDEFLNTQRDLKSKFTTDGLSNLSMRKLLEMTWEQQAGNENKVATIDAEGKRYVDGRMKKIEEIIKRNKEAPTPPAPYPTSDSPTPPSIPPTS